MKLEVYAVHDAAVGSFNNPLFFRSRGEAIRSFQDAVANEQNGFRSHAADYSFWQIGYYNQVDAVLEPLAAPDRVCGAKDFLTPPDKLS